LEREKVEDVNAVVVGGEVEISEPKGPDAEDTSTFAASAEFAGIALDVSGADTPLGVKPEVLSR
jgi:hypothetical protein